MKKKPSRPKLKYDIEKIEIPDPYDIVQQNGLSLRELEFLNRYLDSGEAIKSYMDVFKVDPGVNVKGRAHALLNREPASTYVHDKLVQKARMLEVDIPWLVSHRVEMVERCMQAVPVKDNEGRPTGEWKFDSKEANNALKALELFREAYNETIDLNINYSVSEDVRQILKRVGIDIGSQMIDITPEENVTSQPPRRK